MGYNMKRGAAPKFKELGSSPAKQNTDDAKQKADELLAYTKERGDLEMKPPYKRPTGPRAEVKPETPGKRGGRDPITEDVPLSPGFEDPIKIQRVQREGLVPGSQKFNKKVQTASDLRKFSDLEKYDDDK
tara:strand:+ start:40 stop:429 length:390 start_codon:yes stop_codon:yes gene_type:complete